MGLKSQVSVTLKKRGAFELELAGRGTVRNTTTPRCYVSGRGTHPQLTRTRRYIRNGCFSGSMFLKLTTVSSISSCSLPSIVIAFFR